MASIVAVLCLGIALSTSLAGVVRGELRPESDLTSNCFDFPRHNFDSLNSIMGVYGETPHMMLDTGQDAIDFTLHNMDGEAWNLRAALDKGMPVVMIWGMYTCPAFQGYSKNVECSYWDEYTLVDDYQDLATFVHLYGPEPHPALPGTNFDQGVYIPKFWSSVKQHRSYQDRVDMATDILDLIHPSQVLLPDYFPGNPYSELIQPVWCSYGLGARPVTVIAPDNGKIVFQLDWFRRSAVGQAIDDYWKGKPRIGTKRAHQEEDGIGSYITTTSSYITTTSSSHVSNEVTNTLEQLQGDAYAASQDGQRGVHEICISYPTCTRTA